MKQKIEILYQNFFRKLGIDSRTGEFIEENNIKFATYPYIGIKYHQPKQKILFVGLDIGKDETPCCIQSLEERRENIALDTDFNPHIAGTYIMALFMLLEEFNWQDIWESVRVFSTCQQATKVRHHRIDQNPLDYVSLTNFFKFVDVNREIRSGDKNRKFTNKNVENQLFIDEVKILNPSIIIFQGNCPTDSILSELRQLNIELYKATHPSNRKLGGRQPENYVSSLRKL